MAPQGTHSTGRMNTNIRGRTPRRNQAKMQAPNQRKISSKRLMDWLIRIGVLACAVSRRLRCTDHGSPGYLAAIAASAPAMATAILLPIHQDRGANMTPRHKDKRKPTGRRDTNACSRLYQ